MIILSQSITWECTNCGRQCATTLEDPVCPGCGIRLATWATRKKHEYLREVCSENEYEVFIDACAGSGMLQYPDGSIKKGSPLILEEFVKDKGKLICVEINKKTYGILSNYVSNAIIINDDCNKVILNYVDAETPTLVFIDPNGYGVPPIDRYLVLDLSAAPNTDLLIQYSWRIAREMGFCRKYLFCKDDDCPSRLARQKGLTCNSCYNRSRAIAWKNSLDTWWGPSDWMNWGSMRIEEYVREYAQPLRDNNKVDIHFVQGRSRLNSYHLIFATKFDLPRIGLRKWFKPRK